MPENCRTLPIQGIAIVTFLQSCFQWENIGVPKFYISRELQLTTSYICYCLLFIHTVHYFVILLEFAPFCSTIFNVLLCLNFPPFIRENIIHKRKQKTPRYGQYYWWKNNNIITYIFWLPDSHFLLHHYSQKVDIGLIVNMLVSVETQPMAN